MTVTRKRGNRKNGSNVYENYFHDFSPGINTLLDIMSRMGSRKVKESLVNNNERLEYLGDAVVEFVST